MYWILAPALAGFSCLFGPVGPVLEHHGLQRVLTENGAEQEGRHESQASAVDAYGDPLPTGAVLRIGTVRMRFGGGQANFLRALPNAKLLLSSTDLPHQPVCLWDLTSGRLVRQFPGNSSSSQMPGLSGNGKMLAVLGDASIRIWDVVSGKQLHELSYPDSGVSALAISSDGRMLALCGPAGHISVIDLPSDKRILSLAAANATSVFDRVAFSPQGDRVIISCNNSNKLEICDLAHTKWLPPLEVPGSVRGFALSPDGKKLAAYCHRGGMVSLWDLASGKELTPIVTNYNFVLDVAFSPEAARLAAVGISPTDKEEKNCGIWEVRSGKVIRQWTGCVMATQAATFSADGRELVTAAGSAIRRWDAATGKAISLPGGDAPQFPLRALALSPDGESIISGGEERMLRSNHGSTGRLLRQHQMPSGILSLACSPNGHSMAAGLRSSEAWIINLPGFELEHVLKCGQGGVWTIGFSKNGQRVVTADALGGAGVWDQPSGKQVNRLQWPNRLSQSAVFCPYSNLLVLSGRPTSWDMESYLSVWDLSTSQQLNRLNSLLNARVSEALPQTAQHLFDWVISRAAISPNGSVLALNRWQATIPLFELATGNVRFLLKGHHDSTTSIAFAPDGRILASASRDGTIRLWDTFSGAEIGCFSGHRGAVTALAFFKDGSRLVSCAEDASILVWKVPTRVAQTVPPAGTLSDNDWESLWSDLAVPDANMAALSLLRMSAAPDLTCSRLRARLRPRPVTSPETFTKLIEGLDAKGFAIREKATSELKLCADTVASKLHSTRGQSGLSVEASRRLLGVLEECELPSGDRLRELRACEVLERIGTPEAQSILRNLASGVEEAPLTKQAKASLDFLQVNKHAP